MSCLAEVPNPQSAICNPQECYGAGRLVTARCYGVDSDTLQCFRALLRCYGVQTQGGAAAPNFTNHGHHWTPLVTIGRKKLFRCRTPHAAASRFNDSTAAPAIPSFRAPGPKQGPKFEVQSSRFNVRPCSFDRTHPPLSGAIRGYPEPLRSPNFFHYRQHGAPDKLCCQLCRLPLSILQRTQANLGELKC